MEQDCIRVRTLFKSGFYWRLYGTCGFATLKFLWSFVLGEGCVQSQTQFLKTKYGRMVAHVFVSWCKFMSWGKVFLTPISPFFWDIFIVSLIWLMIKWHNNDNISFSQLCLSFQIIFDHFGHSFEACFANFMHYLLWVDTFCM